MTSIQGLNYGLSFAGLNSKNSAHAIPAQKPNFEGSSNTVDLYSAGNSKFAVALKPLSPNISFGAKKIGGVMYSNAAMALGDAMIKPEEAIAMVKANNDKIEQTQARKDAGNYNNARAEVVQAATVMGDTGKNYTSCNVDFFSSRWGLSAGQVASCLAINDINHTIKAIAVSDLHHDKKSIQWLANTNSKIFKTRGGRELQIVTVRKTPLGKDQIWVKTLSDTKGFVHRGLPFNNPNYPPVITEGVQFEPVKIKVNDIVYSEKSKEAVKKLEAKGINVDEMIKTLAQASQDEANKVDKAVAETDGTFETAPVSHYHYHTALLADDGNIYKASNTEFYDSGFMADVMCSERTAVAKAVNEGANKAEILFVNNNQNHNDAPCAECLGWLSTTRGGSDLLLPAFIRDENGNKTDKVMVHTLGELLPVAHVPSAKVEVK